MLRKRASFGLLAAALTAAVGILTTQIAGADPGASGSQTTRTPIKHVVVIFQENVSFDHYFGTYPTAANTDGQPFAAAPGTPAVDGLLPATDVSLPAGLQHSANLIAANPNADPPKRLDSSPTGLAGDAGGQLTCDQDHNYSDEQQAFDGGLMDQFVQSVGTGGGTTPFGTPCQAATVMDYFDGNAVPALWNYAQHYAMSDNSFGTTFGPSAPGAINLISGDTGGVDTNPAHQANSPSISSATSPNADLTADGTGGYSLTSDAQPFYDDCSTRDAVALTGANIGDELNQSGISWGWFEGGFRPTTSFATAAAAVDPGQSTSTFIKDEFSGSFTGKVVPPHATNQALCDAVHPVGIALGGSGQYGYKDDYIPHHEPFQFYASTANPHHLTIATDPSGNDLVTGPDSLSSVGTDTQSFSGGSYGAGPEFNTPNHQYDTSDFDQLVAAIGAGQLPSSALPAVTFLKAPGYEDGHAAYSDPADEQAFIVNEVNALMKTPDWSSTAVIISYDDSDGWYDHVYSGVTNPSLTVADNLTNTKTGKITALNPTSGQCGPRPQSSAPLGGEQGRCGFGPRLPLMVISSCAPANTVDHNLSDQASIINFIEYNWGLPGISGSYDQALSSTTDQAEGIPFDLAGLFDFAHCNTPSFALDPVSGQIDLRGASERSANLSGVNLSGAEAANADFGSANLHGAFLVNADLEGANLSSANLDGADLAGANLKGADLESANLNRVDLSNANLTGADLASANLHGVTWSNTTCPDGTNSNADGGTCANHGAGGGPAVVPVVTTPGATTPAITVPGVTTPTVTTPDITVPGVTVPGVTTPAVTTPTSTVPGVTTPAVTTPTVTVPGVKVPGVKIP